MISRLVLPTFGPIYPVRPARCGGSLVRDSVCTLPHATLRSRCDSRYPRLPRCRCYRLHYGYLRLDVAVPGRRLRYDVVPVCYVYNLILFDLLLLRYVGLNSPICVRFPDLVVIWPFVTVICGCVTPRLRYVVVRLRYNGAGYDHVVDLAGEHFTLTRHTFTVLRVICPSSSTRFHVY